MIRTDELILFMTILGLKILIRPDRALAVAAPKLWKGLPLDVSRATLTVLNALSSPWPSTPAVMTNYCLLTDCFVTLQHFVKRSINGPFLYYYSSPCLTFRQNDHDDYYDDYWAHGFFTLNKD